MSAATLNRAACRMVRRAVGGRIFGATFRKADGTIRTGAFRLGVRRNLTGAGLAYDAEARGNLIVWDMNRHGYRTIPLRRVIRLRIDGRTVALPNTEE